MHAGSTLEPRDLGRTGGQSLPNASLFHHAIGPLLARMGMTEPQDSQRLAVTLRVDKSLTVALLGHQPGFLVVIAELPEPVDTGDARRLLPLLSANQFVAEHPALIGSVQPDSGRFSLWARQSLQELDENGVVALFERLLAAAGAVRDWLRELPPMRDAREAVCGEMMV
jgi:hypothetical protein